jgi:hypothetical protein
MVMGAIGRNCSTARLSFIMRLRQGERYLERYPWFEKPPLNETVMDNTLTELRYFQLVLEDNARN